MLFWQKGNIIFVTFTHIYRNYEISMYFLRKIIFHFPSKKYHIFGKQEISSFRIIQKRSYSSVIFLERPSFQNIWKKYHIFMYFFWERLFFIFCLNNKIIISGKGNIIFNDNTRKVIFQCIFFGKVIFSEHLEKENMVFRAVKGHSCY